MESPMHIITFNLIDSIIKMAANMFTIMLSNIHTTTFTNAARIVAPARTHARKHVHKHVPKHVREHVRGHMLEHVRKHVNR